VDANAGDYLISHTLSRAVPSARRGLTSVFGMGTGVTLAVCSPASWMEHFCSQCERSAEALVAFPLRKATSNITSQIRARAKMLCGAWWKFPHSQNSLHTRAVSPRNESGKLAPQTCDQERTALGSYLLQSRPVEWQRKLLRRINSMDKPNGRLVLVSCTHYCVSTSSLSTRWSSWALLIPYGLGDLILGRASRLYAFSGYHNRTSLPSRALGRTTGTQEVRPSRSSRTKDSPPQISYAHSR
jgi:hypothetical protein